jgi:hypothetical protein
MAAKQSIEIDRLVLIQRLEDLIKEKEQERDNIKRESKTYKSRLAAWNKKAVEYIRKNGEFGEITAPDHDYHEDTYSIDFSVSEVDLEDELGKRPEQPREPEFFRSVYSNGRSVCAADEVKNAIALYKLSAEPMVKVNASTSWVVYL